ncbi:ABC transporter permease [Paracoccus sp. 1_MG-2023]|uniref:ABC transporter permease n=1 Tax=unclassified Paracoccus (in: a-proteobacteria) TaxID=2688777 RepID=UPI001C094B55|nr:MULTISPECIES: ABC transporter permease [unclassified Paracoccus (in: a-proteobacteria)]MBU2956635.1 ABC transporter permease [Paracoccus sp. C2R09]MDO6668741.1 ABC transporter permease [Paracoccus sp. 1_MG-2023]
MSDTPPFRKPAFPTQTRATRPRQLKEVRKHRSHASFRAITALILREMQTSNGRGRGSYIWAILEPVGGIVMLTMIFSLGFRAPPIGTNFAIFYATGMVPFMAYMDISGKVSNAVGYSKPLLAYPAVTFMDALIARVIFNTITQLMVAIVIFTGICMMMETRTEPQIGGIALAMLMAVTIGTGVGVMNSFLFQAFDWWQSIWSILTRPLFLLSGLFFIFDDVPQPYQDWLWYNPLIHVIGQMRRSFFPSYIGDYVSLAYLFGVGMGLTALGMALLVRYHRDLQYS